MVDVSNKILESALIQHTIDEPEVLGQDAVEENSTDRCIDHPRLGLI